MEASRKRYSLADLADRFGLQLVGNPGHAVSGVGTLEGAGPDDLSFLSNRAYRSRLPATRAGAVILASDDAPDCPVNALVAADPYLAYARAATLFDQRPVLGPGVHPGAVVADTAQLGDGVSIGALAVIGDACEIGAGAQIGPGCVLGAGVRIGPGCRLLANVTLMDGVQLGSRVIVHPGAVIGADGFGIAFGDGGWEKVPQLGRVLIGDDCEIGANTTIDRGAIEDTVLEEDVRVDNLVQIGHNVHIGAHTAIAGCCGIAGSARIGRYCLLGGSAGVAGHVEIADRVTVTARATVMKSITEPGTTWSSLIPARPIREMQRNLARLNRLEQLVDRIKQLESKHRNDPGND